LDENLILAIIVLNLKFESVNAQIVEIYVSNDV